MSAEVIFRALGGARQGSGYVVRCPVSSHGQGRGDRRPSLSVRDSEDKLLVHCHSGCDARDVLDELRRRGLLSSECDRGRGDRKSGSRDATPKLADLGISKTQSSRWARPVALFEEARIPAGTIVERYLALRLLELPGGDALRFHPACPWKDEASDEVIRVPAMLAAMRNILTNEITAVHRTRLSSDGRKLGRRMLGEARGAAIKLDADDEVTAGLTIGEGLETVQAARQLNFKPAWALGSVGAIAAFPVLAGIEALTILAEAGKPSADAVQACGERWTAAGREVIVVSPLTGSDVNDALREAS